MKNEPSESSRHLTCSRLWEDWIFIVALAMLGTLFVGLPSASAQTLNGCIQDVWLAHGNTQSLTCTANDVSVARVTNISISQGGSCDSTGNCTCNALADPPTNCAENPNQVGCVTFDADFEILLTAQTRYDIGLYFGTDGDPNTDGALTGQCTSYIILPEDENGTNFVNLDNSNNNDQSGTADLCGDIINNTKATKLNNPQKLRLQVSVACKGDQNGGLGGNLKLPNCTSWRTSGQNELCQEPFDAYPGAPSKCNCQPGFTVGITVLQGKISVTKSADPTSLDEPGGDVTYTVRVVNNGAINVVLTALTEDDNNDGTVDFIYNNSSTPTLATICGTMSLAPGASTDCTFTRTVSGNAGDNFTDKACVGGTDQNGGTVSPLCDTATVSIRDVLPTAAVTKTLADLECAVVRYHVKVENTDTVESLALTALNDNQFGDITQIHGNVLGTTCGVATTSKGLGTLSAQDGAGALCVQGQACSSPAHIATSGKYECDFDAKFCGSSHTNMVTATLTDNDRHCSTTTTTACKANSDCPTGETCVVNEIIPSGDLQVCIQARGISSSLTCPPTQ